MGRTYDELDPNLISWIEQQHLFFVASAPSDGEGHVNLSPKGYDTFRILDPTTVAYLDLTGSGVETIAHIRQNGRLTVLFCAFEGKPNILRLYGRGEVIEPDHPEFEALAAQFPTLAGTRAVIRCRLDRIASSCGYSVPLLSYQGERDTLARNAERKGADGLAAYRLEKNGVSIDGLPGLPGPSGQPDACGAPA